jgi:hypothetical protein
MNAKLLVVSALLMWVLSSCEKDDKAFSVISADRLSGQISNTEDINFNFVQTLIYTDLYDNYIVGADSVENGKFDIQLTNPPDVYLEEMDPPDGLTSSDPSVKGAGMYPTAIKDSFEYYNEMGTLERTNKPEYYLLGVTSVGTCFSQFLFVERAVKISGSYSEFYEGVTTQYSVNMNLREGWNELTLTCQSLGQNTESWKMTSNDEPSGMQWYYLPYDFEKKSGGKSPFPKFITNLFP